MEYFREIVENIFNRWSALKLTVEHGLGGTNGHQTAISIMNYMLQYCTVNATVVGFCQSEIRDTLEEIMDQEYDTVCEDNSIEEIAELLIKFLRLCRENRVDEIKMELGKMAPCQMWLNPQFRINILSHQSSDSSSDDDEVDEENDESMDIECTTAGDQHQKTASNSIDEESEPGWTTVRTRRSRH